MFKCNFPGKQLVELRGAALGHFGLQHSDQFTQLHAVIQLLHEELRSHVFPQHAREPDGQVLLHREQCGLMPDGEPLVVLEHIGQTGTMALGPGAARTLRTQ